MAGERKRLALLESGRVWGLADERPRGFHIRNKQGRVRIDARTRRDDLRRRSFPRQRANWLRLYQLHLYHRSCDRVASWFDRYDPIVSLPCYFYFYDLLIRDRNRSNTCEKFRL